MLLSSCDREWLRETIAAQRAKPIKLVLSYGGGSANLHWSKKERAARMRQMQKKQPKSFELALERAERAFSQNSTIPFTSQPLRVDWSSMPKVLDVQGGGLPSERTDRKRKQLENIMTHAVRLALPNARIVDFCCGVGHQSLPLAYLRPDCQFILLDKHLPSLQRAKKRAEFAHLRNVQFCLASVQDFNQDFDLGIALHACGAATDDVLTCCIKKGAAFVISPCCLGGVTPIAKSQQLRSALVDPSHFSSLAKAADTVVSDTSGATVHYQNQDRSLKYHTRRRVKRSCQNNNLTAARAKCMTILDLDRLAYAQDHASYATCLTKMVPPSASPKNHILLGALLTSAAFYARLGAAYNFTSTGKITHK